MWWTVLTTIICWELLRQLGFIIINKMNDDE